LTVSGANTYAGGTTVNGGGTFRLGATNAAGTGALAVVAGTFDLNGFNQSSGSLSGAGSVLLGVATLNVGNDNTSTAYSGSVSGAGGGITKVGNGTLTLIGSLTYTGSTAVSAGTLSLATNLLSTSSVNVTGGKLELAPLLTRVLRTPSLVVTGTGKIDIQNNKIITAASIGSATTLVYNGVTGLIQSGRGTGSWNGSVGIVTSQTQATTSNFHSIGIATGAQVKPASATATDTWAGQTITGTDTLVMYTYGGDANLDGKVNVDDYVRIDSNVGLWVANQGVAAWYNGDFNYDGKVNVDDYVIIDSNVANATPAFPTAGGADGFSGGAVASFASGRGNALEGITAVPEPTGLGMIVFASAATAAVRRRRTAAR
jgi:autotransporter-associated beta strand protein